MSRALPRLLLVAACGLFGSLPAAAQWSGASVFTDDGVEIGVEPRVFALYALLNEAGYDKETVFGPAPLERPLFSATREKLRANMSRNANKAVADLIARYPGSVSTYVDAVLELGPAPRFDDKAAKSALAKDLAKVMREWFNEEGGGALLRNANEEAKEKQKRLLPVLNTAVKKTTSIVRLGDASDQLLDDAGAQGRVALGLNELEAHGALAIHVAGDTTGVFAGPFRNADDESAAVDAVVFAYAQTLTARELAKVDPTGTLLAAHERLPEPMKKAWATPKEWGRGLIACAVAREVLQRPATCRGLSGDAESDAALALIAPRMKDFAPTTALFTAALPELLAAPPPPPPEPTPPVEEPRKGGKGKK
jgi:hypothetical protein